MEIALSADGKRLFTYSRKGVLHKEKHVAVIDPAVWET